MILRVWKKRQQQNRKFSNCVYELVLEHAISFERAGGGGGIVGWEKRREKKLCVRAESER